MIKSFRKQFQNPDKAAKYLLGSGVVILLLMPAILTYKDWSIMDFSNTGPIGDTIGGITAPFMSLIGGGLVYLALREQIKANKIITDQIGLAQWEKRIMYFKNELDNFTYSYSIGNPYVKEDDVKLIGGEAIHRFLSDLPYDEGDYESSAEIKVNILTMIVSQMANMMTEVTIIIEKSNNPERDYHQIKDNILLVYWTNLFFHVLEVLQPEPIPSKKCIECGMYHLPIPHDLYNSFMIINKLSGFEELIKQWPGETNSSLNV